MVVINGSHKWCECQCENYCLQIVGRQDDLYAIFNPEGKRNQTVNFENDDMTYCTIYQDLLQLYKASIEYSRLTFNVKGFNLSI